MPKKSAEDLTKVTLNLFTSDVEDFKRRYGFGYTEQIRMVIRDNVKKNRALNHQLDRLGMTFLSEDMVDGEE